MASKAFLFVLESKIAMNTKYPKTDRRKFLLAGGALLTSIGLGGSLPALASTSTKNRVKVAVLAPSHCALPMIYAQLAGFYKEHGLAVDIEFASSMEEIAKGIFSDRIHFGQFLTPMALAAHMGIGPFQGQQQSLVSPMWAGTNGGSMVVRHDSGIKLPQDLKGKTIGVHSRYILHYLITMELLERYNLSPDSDVFIKTINMNNMIEAMKKGEIDGFINAEPLSSAAVAQGVGRDFLLTKDLWFRHPCCCLTAKKSLFDQEKNLFKDFVTATMRSSLALNSPTTRREKLQYIWENIDQYQKLPLPVIQKAFTPGRTDFDPFPFQSSIRVVGKILLHNGLIPKDIAYEQSAREVFLSDYAREILQSLKADNPPANDRLEIVIGKSYA